VRTQFESFHEFFELRSGFGQGAGCVLSITGSGGRALRRLGDIGNVIDDFSCAPCRFSDIAADIGGAGGLFIDGGCNRVGDFVHPGDNVADLHDRRGDRLGIALNGFDILANLLRRLGSCFRQFFYFVGDNCKSLAGFTRAGGFNGGV